MLSSPKENHMAEKQGLVAEFKDFLTTGDLVSIATAFVIGGAIAALIGSFITNIVNGILALLLPKQTTNLDKAWIIKDKIKVGAFISSLITFVALALVVFLLVRAYKNMAKKVEAAAGPSDNDLLAEIRDLLKR
jgi:large conductance mechanosensitive channel